MFALALVKLLAGVVTSVFTLICFGLSCLPFFFFFTPLFTPLTPLLLCISPHILFVKPITSPAPAQGLFYIADVVEEHGQAAKRMLKAMLVGVIVLHVLLLFDRDTPTLQVLVGLAAHLVYVALLPQFPFVHIRSPIAVCSALAAVVNHFSWFLHLLLSDTYIYTYSEVGGIFVVCVWLCPLAFIVSLSSTEPLPITASAATSTSASLASSSGSSSSSDDYDDISSHSRRSGMRKGRSLLAVFCRFLKSKGDQLLPLTHTHTAERAQTTAGAQPTATGAQTAASPQTASAVPVPAIALLGMGAGVPLSPAAHGQTSPHQRKQFVPAFTADDHTQ